MSRYFPLMLEGIYDESNHYPNKVKHFLKYFLKNSHSKTKYSISKFEKRESRINNFIFFYFKSFFINDFLFIRFSFAFANNIIKMS